MSASRDSPAVKSALVVFATASALTVALGWSWASLTDRVVSSNWDVLLMPIAFGAATAGVAALAIVGSVTRRLRRRARATALVVVVLGLLVLSGPTARASCVALTTKERWARADVVLDARALESATPTGVQRFRVLHYLKGRGPAVVRVGTGVIRRTDGSGVVGGEDLFVRRGERWRIFAHGSPRRVLRSSVCDGSRRL